MWAIGVFLAASILCHLASECHGLSRSDDPITLHNWRWKCQGNQCVRIALNEEQKDEASSSTKGFFSLDGCKSICGTHGALWPHPKKSQLIHDLTEIRIDAQESCCQVRYQTPDRTKDYIDKTFAIFLNNVHNLSAIGERPEPSAEAKLLKISVTLKDDALQLDLDTKEDYTISVIDRDDPNDPVVEIRIAASTFFGARHAFETLSQLITFDPLKKRLQIVKSASISDSPAFPYRGLLLDTGRNYFSVSSIKRILSGMSADKLNVLHWHINEQQSFPFVSESVPELTKYGAYSEHELYYPSDVRDLVTYGHLRGVQVLPEFDAPAHASMGWQFGKEKGMGDLVVCAQKEWNDGNWSLAAEPPSGQLNPLNEHVYDILEKVYEDMLKAFTLDNQPVSMFHMGGDEVNFPCWAKDAKIREWVAGKANSLGLRSSEVSEDPANPDTNPDGYLELWSQFQAKARSRLVAANKGKKFKHDQIVWTSELAKAENIEKYLPVEDYIIQLWCSGLDYWIADLLSKGYRTIFSNSDAWYLDCGFGAWIYSGQGSDNNWCSPFKSWKTFYGNSPRDLIKTQGLAWDQVKHLVLGGESALWSEQVDIAAVESRTWPRLSAMAERLWSDPSTTWQSAETRLLQHRHRLVQRGIRADAIQPEFCRQNEGYCYMPMRRYELNSNGESGPVMPVEDLSLAGSDRDYPLHQRQAQQDEKSSHSSTASLSYISLILVAVAASVCWVNRRIFLPLLISRIKILRERLVGGSGGGGGRARFR